MTSGIYLIINLYNGLLYVGSASDFERRWKEHLRDLNSNLHPNKHLQAAWNLYGEDAFQFTIVEEVEQHNLIAVEQLWIDASNSHIRGIGYNICKVADNRTGIKHSEETKKKIALFGIGKKFSDDRKLKISIANKGKLRNLAKWPCELGKKCRCEDCLKKKCEYQKNWYNTKFGSQTAYLTR